MKKILYTILSIILLLIALSLIAIAPDVPAEDIEKKYANAESRFIDIDGLRVHYRDEGSGMPVVLLHGTAASLHTWEGWTEELKSDYRVIRMDLPAFGLTGPNKAQDYSSPAYTKFLDAFLTALNIDSCYLAGNSLGGRIAWEYCWRYPGKVRKLILVDAAGYRLPGDPEPSLGFRLARMPLLNHIVRYFTPRSLMEKSLREVYGDDEKVTTELIDRYYDMMRREGNRDAFIARARHDFTDNTAKLSTIDIPTLLLWGDGDIWIPLTHAEKFRKDLPNATLVVYKGAGHIPMEELPEQTVADAKIFLAN